MAAEGSGQPPGANHRARGVVTLVGAGELMPAMSPVHRAALNALGVPPNAVFLDTTAGYETNADAITAKAIEYYAHRLQTELRPASFRHAGRASLAETARAVSEVRAANFIFAGPGSPSYALEHLRGSQVWDAVVERFRQGAHLFFASAASIIVGRYALPVYEIYKAGRDPFWLEGLDILGDLDLRLAVIPHFNDHSGGANYDSRFCYMGAARFDLLQAQLPPDVTILGIDEYTAARIAPESGTLSVIGQGSVTLIVNGEWRVLGSGSVVPLDHIVSSRRAVVPTYRPDAVYAGYEYADPGPPAGFLESLAGFVQELPLDSAARVELLARVEAATESAAPAARPDEGALVELVLELRTALRDLKRWDLADRAREVLLRLGYEVQDTSERSLWRRRS